MDEPLRGEDSGPWWGDGGSPAPATGGPCEGGADLPGEGGGEHGERAELAGEGRVFPDSPLVGPVFSALSQTPE